MEILLFKPYSIQIIFFGSYILLSVAIKTLEKYMLKEIGNTKKSNYVNRNKEHMASTISDKN